jgi:mitochondrial enoyl-[acyl-carrier protein] reductase / trans-2-enoyl-CoA reductase
MSAQMVRIMLMMTYREDIDVLKQELQGLGATHVLTYDELINKSTRAKVKEWTNGQVHTSLK